MSSWRINSSTDADTQYRKQQARWAVKYALKTGRLVRGYCEEMFNAEEIGQNCAGPIEAHHDDYTKQLEVRWLCRKHHRELEAVRMSKTGDLNYMVVNARRWHQKIKDFVSARGKTA